MKRKKFNKRSKWCGVNKTERRFCLEFFSGKWVIRHIVTDGEFDDEIYYSSSDAECPTGSDVSGRQKMGLENSGFEIFSDLTQILTFFPS